MTRPEAEVLIYEWANETKGHWPIIVDCGGLGFAILSCQSSIRWDIRWFHAVNDYVTIDQIKEGR